MRRGCINRCVNYGFVHAWGKQDTNQSAFAFGLRKPLALHLFSLAIARIAFYRPTFPLRFGVSTLLLVLSFVLPFPN